MNIEIDLEDLTHCNKCGIVFMKSLVLKRGTNGSPNDATGYWEHEYKGNCPVCKNEISEWR